MIQHDAAKIRTKWLKALRSGAYPKGKGFLKQSDNYCALGVLLSVCGIEPRYLGPLQGYEKGTGYEALPITVPDETWIVSDRVNTFAEVADWLEEQWKHDR